MRRKYIYLAVIAKPWNLESVESIIFFNYENLFEQQLKIFYILSGIERSIIAC